MNNTITIARRQFLSYFNGPVAYVVGVLFLAMVGMTFFVFPGAFFLQGRASVRDMFFWITTLTMLVAPALTMGLIAEEKRAGTIELLLTMPVKDGEVVMGKFLAAFGLYAFYVVLTIVHPISVSTLGNMDWGPVLAAYVGILLYGGAMLAIGLMFSSFTENQLVALFASFVVCFIVWIIDKATPILPAGIASITEWLSFDYHFQSMQRGVIDTRDVVFFLSVAGLSLGLAFRALESRRWR